MKTINEIVKGKAAITAETALQLERVLDVPARFWLNLEMLYRETLARIHAERELERDADCVARFPYSEMAKWGWVSSQTKRTEKVYELLKFFSVSSFAQISEVEASAFRIATKWNVSKEALAAWLRQGEIQAQDADVQALNRERLRGAIARLRSLTRSPAKHFSHEIQSICANCGVAVVFVPHLKGTHVNGAARFLANHNRALIQLSLRYRYADIFWFSLFHEIGHVLLHVDKMRDVFVDFVKMKESPMEAEANSFAADALIPPESFEQFVAGGGFSNEAIRAFADEIGIAPGIVGGRLARERLVEWNAVSSLRPQLIFVSEREGEGS